MAVRVVVSWRGALQGGRGLGMAEMRVTFDGKMCFDPVKAEQLSEAVGDVYRGFAHGMAQAMAILDEGG